MVEFQTLLVGKKFTLRTDRSSLAWMQNVKEPEGQLALWLEKLHEYDFTVLNRQGSRHSNADALSRIPCRQRGRGDLCGKEACAVDVILPHIPQTNSLDEVRRMQAEDNNIGPVLEAVRRGKAPDLDVSKSCRGRESRIFYYNNGTRLSVTVVCSGDTPQRGKRNVGSQLVLPYSLRQRKVIQDLPA